MLVFSLVCALVYGLVGVKGRGTVLMMVLMIDDRRL